MAQEKQPQEKEVINKIEVFIFDKKLDSVKHYLKLVKKDSYLNILQKIVNNELVSNNEYLEFISKSGNKSYIDYDKVSHFINTHVKTPKGAKIDLDYVEIKWVQISEIRNNGNLAKSSALQTELENYINRFNSKDIDVVKAKLKISTHPIVMYLIEKEIKKGKELALNCLKKAREINDKELQITFLYHLSDFLVEERKLQEYIDVSEESLELEKQIVKKSPYYYSTIEHLIDAYVFKGGSNDKVITLIDEIYNNPVRRIHTFYLYAELLSRLEKNAPLKFEILKKFEAKNVEDLIQKLEVLGEDLNSNDKLAYANAASRALISHDFFDLAIKYKDKAIEISKNIYSKELSETLSNYKTAIAVKEKEVEIVSQKEKIKVFIIITFLIGVFFVISLFTIRKIRRQSKELSEKNKLINQSLKDKELLVKEVHHRVKNNFQIVSSLLELQSKGIEDEKALELANEGKNRVKSMALIHQKLYQNESGLVDFDEYIHLLVKELSSLFKSENKIDTLIKSEDMNFDVDTAIPLGLIINEIITNSYKYAFKQGKENTLSISINKENNDNFKLIIEDNGPGISDSIDVKKTKSLGLRLVNRLVKQLHGTLNLTNESGARFEILFKDMHARQLVD